MTREETQRVLNLIDGSYKNFIMGRDRRIVFQAWCEAFQNQDFKKVYAKVMEWVTTKNTPPAISDLVCVDWRKRYEQRAG